MVPGAKKLRLLGMLSRAGLLLLACAGVHAACDGDGGAHYSYLMIDASPTNGAD
eukprot:COSAG02_NODE_39264_length_419_cov_0.800000_1_plen_53_part_01